MRLWRICISFGRDVQGVFKKMSGKITYLVLDQKLNTLDRSSGGLRDSGGNTSHCYRMSVTVPNIYNTNFFHLSRKPVGNCRWFGVVPGENDILKKSITKGGLWLKSRREGLGSGCRRQKYQQHHNSSPISLSAPPGAAADRLVPMADANWDRLRFVDDVSWYRPIRVDNHKLEG